VKAGRTVGVVVALAALVSTTTGCRSKRYTREQVRDRWVETYAERFEITEAEAGCVVDQFFATLDDAELRPLTNGKDFTPAQLAELEVIVGDCLNPPADAQ
jgi:hypothetical protein